MEYKSQITPIHNLPPIEYQNVADITERDAIPSNVRYLGMEVYVVADDTKYKLVGGLLNTNWVESIPDWSKTTETFTIDSTILTNGYIDLANTPTGITIVKNNGLGLPQTLEWTISGSRITFIISSTNILTVGDVIEVIYNY